jgi:integrase
LAQIGKLLDQHAVAFPQSVAFIYLLLYSGARPAEIGQCQRAWLDGNVLRLPDSKTGQRDVYLPPQAMAVIGSLPPYRDGTITGIKSPRALWRLVRAAAGCPDLRLYPDLRRSFATVGVAAGNSMDLMGGLLGHKNRQTTMIYARLMEDAAQDAAASTATAMEKLLNG